MRLVGLNCFDPLRRWWRKPIGISSFYRSPELNKAIKGSKNSQHCKGQAIDIDADMYHNGITNKMIFTFIQLKVIDLIF